MRQAFHSSTHQARSLTRSLSAPGPRESASCSVSVVLVADATGFVDVALLLLFGLFCLFVCFYFCILLVLVDGGE